MSGTTKSCMIIGDALTDYEDQRVFIEIVVNELMKNHGFNYFCTPCRNSFERIAAESVDKFREFYPGTMNVIILAKRKTDSDALPACFDTCLYYPARGNLLDSQLVKNAYRKGIENSDALLSGVEHVYDTYAESLDLAENLGKEIFFYRDIYKHIFARRQNPET